MKTGSNFQNWGTIESFRDDIVTIGDNVVLGNGSIIITHCPISFYNGKSIGIDIGNNVYIGAGCAILPGTKIGNNSVIGAGSVVAGEIRSGVVAAGNPCRVIRDMEPIEIKRVRLLMEQRKIANGSEPEGLNEAGQ
jgi:acetyltransferase-like isoleucine patch superfamily enzyme